MTRSSNPVRFGLNIRGFSEYGDIVAVARAAESARFETVTFSDRPPEANFEGWTLATAVATATERINVTHSTLNVPYRFPALLAKAAASLDIIAGGSRVRLTLGAGGQEAHSTSFGMPWGSPGERVDGLIDTIAILRGMWANDSFSYEGKRYSVADAVLDPKPAAAIPIFIGALGPRMLKLVGTTAEGWLKNGGWPKSPEAYAELQEQVDRGAEQAGRDPATIRRVVNCNAYVGDADPSGALAPTLGNPGGLLGTPDQIFEIIEAHREAGVDTFHVQFANDIVHEQLPAFGEQIIAKMT